MLLHDSNLSAKKRVGIIGGNSPDNKSLKDAETLGKLVAQNGYILVNGGMKGVMEASARGAKSEDGFIVAIIPGKYRGEANHFSDIVITTGLGYIRNPLVVLNSDILVAVDGSYGTLSEIAYAKIYGRIVYGLNTWNVQGIIPLATPEEVIKEINSYFSR